MRNKRLIVLLSIVVTIVLVIVACGATFLVRDIDAYSYYGDVEYNGVNYDDLVVKASGIKKNSSIFFLDEKAVKNRVENAFANIRVVNVERKFPDRVSINYVIYENSFQYERGGKYYQCYSSGRIGGSSERKMSGYFTLKPKNATSTREGEYFQGSGGYDRKAVVAFIKFMYSKGLNDRQINERIDFVDLTRDGYIYIRTAAGCSIELHGELSEFNKLIERGWNIFADPNPDSPVTSRTSGLIQVYILKLNGKLQSTYIGVGKEFGKNEDGTVKHYSDETYYAEYYSRNA
ncbi:MAG: FtsQ-type POTRA domain-containing protein [Clostridiales bacterium]|nr:FtsQ-type POTRA domain-containing protein [Clostridiales bacterium]